jgi:hypothetical protein
VREFLNSHRSHQANCCIHRFIPFPVARRINHLTRSLCSGPITGPSSLIRIGPSQCSTSVRSPHGFNHLHFSLGIGATGSRSSVRKPVSDSRPLYAGRRLPSNQGSRQASPRSSTRLCNDASAEGLLSLVSLTPTSTGIPCTLAPTLTTATLTGWSMTPNATVPDCELELRSPKAQPNS